MSRINYPAVKKYKRRDRSIHPSIHRAFETAAPMYVTYVGPGDKSRGSFAPRKGLLRCVGIAQFVSGSRGERGIEGRRRGEESVPRDVNFSTGEKRKICGNTERSTPLSFFLVISPATLHARLCKIVRWIRKRGRSWINRSSRCAYFPPRKNDAGGQAFKVMYEGNWTIRFERQISGGAYPMQLYLERERDWIKGVMQSGLSQGIIQRVQVLRGSNPVYHRLTRARLSGGGEGRNSSFTPFPLVVSSDYFNPR